MIRTRVDWRNDSNLQTLRAADAPSHMLAGTSETESKRLRFLRAKKNGIVTLNLIAMLIATVIVYARSGSKNAINVVTVRRCPQKPHVWR